MSSKAADPRKRVLDEVTTLASEKAPADCPVDVALFVGLYYANVSVEDLQARRASDLAGSALQHLKLAMHRKPGHPLVRIFNPDEASHGWNSEHTVVEIVNDDMPFLVDSLGMVINDFNLYIHVTVHPVLIVRRDPQGNLLEVLSSIEDAGDAQYESYIHLEVDRESDPKVFRALESRVKKSLSDVRGAFEDWSAMRRKARDICRDLEENPPPLDQIVIDEAQAFLDWMDDDHFTFLGYREYDLIKGTGLETLKARRGTGLGILRKSTKSTVASSKAMSRAIRRHARSKDLLILTKANARSTVHRVGYLDYVGVKDFDDAGRVVGEKRFLGLFTSVAYSRSPRSIPVLRHKVQKVMAHSGLRPGSHGGKALLHILDSFPRDELFQASVEELSRIAHGILNLQERQQVRIFVRRDAFRRFFSCLVYVPRDRYNTLVRERIEDILSAELNGTQVESEVQMSESKLARVHFIVRTDPENPPRVRLAALEKTISEAVRTWHDGLRDELVERFGEQQGLTLFRRYGEVFPAAYVEDVTVREATFDIERLAAVEQSPDQLRMSLYRPPSFPEQRVRFKTFHADAPLPISDVLPMLENLGLRVISERPYRVRLRSDREVWVQDFEMLHRQDKLVPSEVNEAFQQAFEQAWSGITENDGFNGLILGAGLSSRQVSMLRAFCRYILQTGLPFSQSYMERVLGEYPGIARLLVQKFEARFDPALDDNRRRRLGLSISQALDHAMDSVATLDADRIISAFREMIRATLRTNFFQPDETGGPKPYISLKLDPRKIPDLPKPRPMFEVFVYSPRVEGVHLRGGRVARGGLRWSDRPEDFRTEVLGLMKAQAVKNTLIVPVGAKGGFVAKCLPSGDREQVMQEVVDCYTTFIRGLLDITDNLVEGEPVSPQDVLSADDSDPYLVVAADKGTATFSDIANGISADYDFWLGDAFASGGSVGYDHKGMGITARGAWECVKRHFREIGRDIQNEDFTVAGIGDMSGDVFGNGMLQSRHTRLQAAFNHLHIFLDPSPDAAASFRERKRLFALPRSGWDDYDRKLISKGGGVFSRAEKVIKLSPQAQAMLDIEERSLTPDDLVRAILRMRVDLLWNGGIGTYVKASTETNADAGDRNNDGVRVNGKDLRCKVLGEGGNLGCTQLGRIEFARHEGRLNTDFIDNSAGVDCSDREVNIKILLNIASQQAGLTAGRRKRLLADMTDEVATQVLRNNYLQSQAISLMEAGAVERIREHQYLVHVLERSRILDRALEFLPDDEEITQRRKAGRGLTRPELAVLVSYGKMSLYADIIASDVPEDAYLSHELISYFPQPLQRRYRQLMGDHRLAREIIATQVTNSLVNRMGPVFAYRTRDETGADVASVARAYAIAREVFDVRSLWTSIEELDNQIHANAQYSMMNRTTRLLKHGTHWLLDRPSQVEDIEASVKRFSSQARQLSENLSDFLVGRELRRFSEAFNLYKDLGTPDAIAHRMAGLHAMHSALDIIEVAQDTKATPAAAAQIYFLLGQELRIDWLRDRVEQLSVEGRWQAMARNSMRENLYHLQGLLTRLVIKTGRRRAPEAAVGAWIETHKERVDHVLATASEMTATGAKDFPTLSVAMQEIRRLTQL